jgi:hypothetical protein
MHAFVEKGEGSSNDEYCIQFLVTLANYACNSIILSF